MMQRVVVGRVGSRSAAVRPSWCWMASAIIAGVGLACSKSSEPNAGASAIAEPAPLRWFEDDPRGAMRLARAERRPVFVDLWAPWCHTCLSMKSFVLTRENVPALAKDFVLLAIDTEKAENAAFLERFPVTVWPTFYVIAPPDGAQPAAATADADLGERGDIVGRWLGGGSAGQMQRFLTESARTAALRGPAVLTPDDPLHHLALADRLATSGDFAAAASAYAKALELSPPNWPRRPETLVAQITALAKAKSFDECLELGNAAMGQTGASASAVDFSHHALDCAERLPSALAVSTQKLAEGRLAVLCRDGSSELSPDDHADACNALASVRSTLGDADGARRATLQRLAVLERAALGKPIDVALAYDWARTDVLIALDRAAEALPFLIEHERAAPNNYNPPQQQARCYKALGRWEEGLAAIERALALAYGPRKAGFLTLKADLLLGADRSAEARAVVEQQLAAYRALPAGQRQPAAEQRVATRLADWKDPLTR